jgi:WD40 repeat protein
VAFEVPEPRVRHVALAQVERLEVGEALEVLKPLVRHLGSGKVHGKVRHEGYSHQPAQMSFSPDGRRLATCGGLGELQHGTGVKLWDLATGQEVLTLARSKIAVRVAFSPNGDRLAAAFSQNAASMFMASTSGETWIWDGTAVKNEP